VKSNFKREDLMIGSGITKHREIRISSSPERNPLLEQVGSAHMTLYHASDWSEREMSKVGITVFDPEPRGEMDLPAWFAWQIARNLKAANESKGDLDFGLAFACRAGELFGIAKLKFKWESDALRGVKVREGGKKGAVLAESISGRSRTAQAEHAEWQQWAESLGRKYPDWSLRNCALTIKREHQISRSVEQIRKVIRKTW
jgi:hypothetical protein